MTRSGPLGRCAAVSLLALLGGCEVRVLHPVGATCDTASAIAAVGTWREMGPTRPDTLRILRADAGCSLRILGSSPSDSMRLEVRRTGKRRFYSYRAADDTVPGFSWGLWHLAADTLEMDSPDLDSFAAWVRRKSLAGTIRTDGGDTSNLDVLVTEEPAEFARKLEARRDRASLFDTSFRMVRIPARER